MISFFECQTLILFQDSHYVLTTNEGVPPAYPGDQSTIPTIGESIFDEIVINQEQQVIPAFILTFQQKSLIKLLKEFQITPSKHPQNTTPVRTRQTQEESNEPRGVGSLSTTELDAESTSEELYSDSSLLLQSNNRQLIQIDS